MILKKVKKSFKMNDITNLTVQYDNQINNSDLSLKNVLKLNLKLMR